MNQPAKTLFTAEEIFVKGQLLTLAGAKARLGKRLICSAREYRMNRPHIVEFTPTEIISDYDWAKRQPLEGYANLAEYWESYMHMNYLDQHKAKLVLLDENGHKVYACHTYLLGPGETPLFTGSDTDRPIYFIEL